MTESFTTTINPTNSLDMNEQETTIENIGADEVIFYNAIRADLDMIAFHPKADTVQKILNHSKSLR
jgi:hypothetical protein